MLNAKILRQVERLPLKERMALIEYAVHSVQAELAGKPASQKGSRLQRLAGILKVEGVTPPTNAELKQMYVDYLVEKYK